MKKISLNFHTQVQFFLTRSQKDSARSLGKDFLVSRLPVPNGRETVSPTKETAMMVSRSLGLEESIQNKSTRVYKKGEGMVVKKQSNSSPYVPIFCSSRFG